MMPVMRSPPKILKAEAELARRSSVRGLEVIDEALTNAADSGEQIWVAELHRLRGELLLVGGNASAAKDEMKTALETARLQGARSLELRAAMSLAPLAEGSEGRELVSGVLEGFTEGFDTADLQDAKALLEST